MNEKTGEGIAVKEVEKSLRIAPVEILRRASEQVYPFLSFL